MGSIFHILENIFIFFLFYGEILDTRHGMGFGRTAWWSDVHLLWNGHHPLSLSATFSYRHSRKKRREKRKNFLVMRMVKIFSVLSYDLI